MRECLLVDEIDSSRKLDANSTNAFEIHYFICHYANISIEKVHLKHGIFKNIVAEKYHAPQHHLGKTSHADLLQSTHETWNVNARHVNKMINDGVNPKSLCFC